MKCPGCGFLVWEHRGKLSCHNPQCHGRPLTEREMEILALPIDDLMKLIENTAEQSPAA